MAICEYYNLPFINFECPIDELPDLDKVEQILKENRDIALVYTTHNETGTGILNPYQKTGIEILGGSNAGDSFISTIEIYGGSVNLFSHTLRRLVDWTNGKFPDLTEPDESYHGISYTETYGKKAYIMKARMQLMRVLAFTLPHIPRFY